MNNVSTPFIDCCRLNMDYDENYNYNGRIMKNAMFLLLYSYVYPLYFGNKGIKNKYYVINLEADTVLTCFNIIVISIITNDKVGTCKKRLFCSYIGRVSEIITTGG